MTINLIEYLRHTAYRHPEKTAVVDEKESLTFAQLEQSAYALSGEIVARSPQPNRPVAVFLEKSCEAVAALFATLMSGKCYCPLDVKSPPERLQRMLRTLQADVAVTSERLLPQLVAAGLPAERIVVAERVSGRQRPVPWTTLEQRLRPLIDTDPAYVIFTSGSTGEPKGVTVSHRGVIDYISWAKECYQVDAQEVIGNQSPFFFDNSTLDLYLMAATGATLHLIPETCYRFPVKLVDYLQEKKISLIFWVPSVLVTVANLQLLDGVDLPALDKILFAGEVMPVRQLNYWRDRVPHALFSNLYGPTEITVDCTYFHVPANFAGADLPIGHPCRNSDILILNDRNEAANLQEMGELCVRGSSLALGYWNNPEKTREVFCQNPLHALYNDWIYRTGDLVWRDAEGIIHFAGRKDNQIKHHGYRIELGEIESAAREIAAVGQCCALYENQEIHLFVELCAGGELAEVQTAMQRKLPRYMVPTKYHRVVEMPLTANGKTDRMALTALFRSEHGIAENDKQDAAGRQAWN